MLLSNMSKLDAVARQILALRVPFTIVTSEPSPAPEGTADDNAHEDAPAAKMAKLETATEEIAALDLLLEVFLKGEGKKYNPNANYDFLASVFANVSLVRRPLSLSLVVLSYTQSGTDPASPPHSFLKAAPSSSPRPTARSSLHSPSLSRSPSTRRRSGEVASRRPSSALAPPLSLPLLASLEKLTSALARRNAAFEKAGHTRLVASSNDGPAEEGCIDLLVQLLLPLCGNEEFDIDVRLSSSSLSPRSCSTTTS